MARPKNGRWVRPLAFACALVQAAGPALAEPAGIAVPTPWNALWLVAIGLGLAGLLAMALRWMLGERRSDAADASLGDALRRVDSDARLVWQMLSEQDVVDGYALWDENERMVACSGTLERYLPQLAEWKRPYAREVIAALVDSGQLLPPEGLGREDAIDAMTANRQVIPGLRELRMGDGQVYLGRTIDLGDRRTASIFTNVTVLREREEAHRTTEALLRTAFDTMPAMMVLVDAQERPIAVNRAFSATLGYSLERFVEMGLRGILHPEDATADPPPWTPPVRRVVTADGAVLRTQFRFTPVRDAAGRRDGRLLVSIEDLTARWETEERVRFQASLLDQVSNAVLAVDRQGRILYGNRAAQNLFQWSGADLIGAPIDRLLGSSIKDALAGDTVELECEGRTWSQGRFPAAITIARTAEDSAVPAGAVLMVTDLTQRRALDLQLMHSARLATLGEMAASIAHEFNQCLHVIRLASEALRFDVGDGRFDVERYTRRADNILAQVDRLTEMVMQMRTISRRDAQAKKPFHPARALDAALRMVEPLLLADGVKVVRVGGAEGALVIGHQVRLEQVLLNLLNNARDSIHERIRREGGGTGTLTVRAQLAAGKLSIAVADDGTGVPDEVGAHIFEPFVTTKDETRGCGLGLSISRGICTEMGGALTFRNLDQGAEFVVELPLSGMDADAAQPALPASVAPAPAVVEGDAADDEEDPDQRRLLLVDDEALSVMMVGEFLERQGYVVDKAYDGVEALGQCERHVYDAVITDIRMPRMDGRALIAHLDQLQPGTPVIVVTGHLKEGSGAELGPNVVAILPKPFQLAHLREQLQRLEGTRAAAPSAQLVEGE